jgi:hypothetical protein
MGRINLILPDDFDEKFRDVVFQKYGMKKGNITEAITEALKDWMKKNEKEKRGGGSRPT